MNYHLMLKECVRGLVAAGRKVVVVECVTATVCAICVRHRIAT